MHKRWLSDKPGRDPLKAPKDRHQAEMVWAAVRERMPHFPVNDAFRAELPDALQATFDQLSAAKGTHRP